MDICPIGSRRKFPVAKQCKKYEAKMKKMMTEKKIKTIEEVYCTHTQRHEHTSHYHLFPSFAEVCKAKMFLRECNKAGLLFCVWL